jgi:amino acid permease
MSKLPRIVGILLIVSGCIMIVVGGVTYYLVHSELADEKITVSDDAANFAGEPVEGPFTAYAEAMVIKKHALEASGGLTYAELDQDDERRATVQNASFLRASLFTSVVAFGVAFLVGSLGLLFILIGLAIISLSRRVAANVLPPSTPGAHSVHDEPAVDTDADTETESKTV